MARNIEIKAQVSDPVGLALRVANLADSGPIAIFQDDTFFACTEGRLKLRDFGNGTGDLIFYRRPDQSGPKESFYILSPTQSPSTLREALKHSNGISGRVVKQRTLFLIGQTRVHLDNVEGLGDFMELEVVLEESQSNEHGARIAHDLMAQLAIPEDALIEGAYLDLLRTAEATT